MPDAPSPAALRAFDAVLRTGNLTAAARDLGVTPAAISHRLRDIEALAGQPLLQRTGTGWQATAAGAQVAAALGDAFARIRAADAVLRGLVASPVLRIVAPMSFTVLWLLPRLTGFEALYPDVTPYVAAAADPLRQDGDAPDVRIAHGVRSPGRGWSVLARDATVVACAPGHVALHGGLTDLAGMRAAHIDSPGGIAAGTVDWAVWAAAKGLTGVPPGPHVSAEHVAADLALQGDTLTLASTFTLAAQFAAGRLRAVPGSRVDAGVCYWLRAERAGPVADAFVTWLRWAVSEAVADQAGEHRYLGL